MARADPAAIQPGPQAAGPLLLPPSLRSGEASPLRERVEPLLQRAAATAGGQQGQKAEGEQIFHAVSFHREGKQKITLFAGACNREREAGVRDGTTSPARTGDLLIHNQAL